MDPCRLTTPWCAACFSSPFITIAFCPLSNWRESTARTRWVRRAASCSNPDSGSATEEVEVGYDADPLDIGFNSRYLLDMMAQMEGETAQFVLADGTSPALVRDTADVGALYVVMPMRV